ncbi:MAG: hypothetical protein K6T83_04035 [Alicyclobacillus sp.]|nr:hypothetical protein [Alicyclobacillus sp.]
MRQAEAMRLAYTVEGVRGQEGRSVKALLGRLETKMVEPNGLAAWQQERLSGIWLDLWPDVQRDY